jgi:hypothetical protein
MHCDELHRADLCPETFFNHSQTIAISYVHDMIKKMKLSLIREQIMPLIRYNHTKSGKDAAARSRDSRPVCV